jgi:riboflavin kinase
MHEFKSDFYGYDMNALVLGYIRPELDYTTRGASFSTVNTFSVLNVFQRR